MAYMRLMHLHVRPKSLVCTRMHTCTRLHSIGQCMVQLQAQTIPSSSQASPYLRLGRFRAHPEIAPTTCKQLTACKPLQRCEGYPRSRLPNSMLNILYSSGHPLNILGTMKSPSNLKGNAYHPLVRTHEELIVVIHR